MGVPRSHVTITVTNGVVSVVPNPVHVSKSSHGEVCWHCPQGTVIIQYQKSPFQSDRFEAPRGGSVSSGPVVGEPGTYKYDVIVTLPDDRRQYVLDPETEVDP